MYDKRKIDRREAILAIELTPAGPSADKTEPYPQIVRQIESSPFRKYRVDSA